MPAKSQLRLRNGSRVGVIGGGPAGSFFSAFLIRMAELARLELSVEIFEPRDFSKAGPAGCNMCGGIISESLVQDLAAEGIALPTGVVQRGIDSYVLHTEAGGVRIATPRQEMRIAAVHRGAGPRDVQANSWRSLDEFLLNMAIERGACRRTERVIGFERIDGLPTALLQDGRHETYDLLAIAIGINSGALKLLGESRLKYSLPKATRTLIREYFLGATTISRHLGSSMHVFLLNLPRLEFAAIIPKGDYATVCLLGENIDGPLISAFMNAPAVRSCFPPNWEPELRSCQCAPWISTHGAPRPYGERVVYLGDCGATRLYKDGIGAAYRAAKSAAQAVAFNGLSAEELRRSYGRHCRKVEADNGYGRVTFGVTRLIQRVPAAHGAICRAVSAEQRVRGGDRRVSMILWDLFTGSRSYRRVFIRMMHPAFLFRLMFGFFSRAPFGIDPERAENESMKERGALGRWYEDKEVVLRQGETGDALYVIQEGRAGVFIERDGQEIFIRELGPGDIVGEMAVFDREVRSATVRAAGRARVLTVERDNLLRRIQEDPSLAFNIMRTMSHRIRQLSGEISRLKTEA